MRRGSYFERVSRYAGKYHLSPVARSLFSICYPFYRLDQVARQGRGWKKTVARFLSPLNRAVCFRHSLRRDGRRLIVPVSFQSFDLASFGEIFWNEEYGDIQNHADIRTVCDIGANTGMSSLFFLANLPSVEMVYAVEANPVLISRLRRDLDHPQVTLTHACITGKQSGPMYFKALKDHRLSCLVGEEQKHEPRVVEVKALSLRALLSMHSLPAADLLKMDIEGAEHLIMRDDPEVFRLFHYLYFEIHGTPQRCREFKEKLAAMGIREVTCKNHEAFGCETTLFENSDFRPGTGPGGGMS